MSDAVKKIRAPFDEATARSLRAGDRVLISGTILAARDAAHKRLVETLDRGEALPGQGTPSALPGPPLRGAWTPIRPVCWTRASKA